MHFQHLNRGFKGYISMVKYVTTPWKINMELENHLFEEEDNLPTTFNFGFHVSQGRTVTQASISETPRVEALY